MIVSLLLFTAPGIGFWWGWLSLSCLIVLLCLLYDKQICITPLFTAMCIYTLVILTNIYFINPVFHVEGLYFISFLFLSYLLGRHIKYEQSILLIKFVICIFSILAIWGVIQYLTQTAYIVNAFNRANTVYHTPNSFAAAINLILLPIVIVRLYEPKKIYLDKYILLLLLGLLVTQSRGGWIAFSGGLFLGLLILVKIRQLPFNKPNLKLFLKAFFLIVAFVYFNQFYSDRSLISRASISSPESDDMIMAFSSVNHRLHFYKIALDNFLEKPILGNGYFNYKYFLDRDNTPEFAKLGSTNFVHNDYLQHLFETGVIGLASLLLVIACFYYQSWLCIKNKFSEYKSTFIAITAGVSAFFIHAVGDFVFYLPGLSVFLGLTLGIFDRYCYPLVPLKNISLFFYIRKNYKTILKTFVASIIIIYLGLPILANKTNELAKNYQSENNFTEALNHYQITSKLAPYEAGYIRDEAQLWLKGLKNKPSQEVAEITDSLLLKGIEINPYEQNNLLTRSTFHRDYAPLLKNAVSIDTIIKWQEVVLKWQPENKQAKLEYIKSLTKAGKTKKARKHYQELQQKIMQNANLNNLLLRALDPSKRE